MFEIDDTFLANVGYDVERLTEEQKDRYKSELTLEVNTRIADEMATELTPAQVEDLESIQNSSERANQWLQEFHNDFEQQDDYKTLLQALDNQEAQVFYATALWLQDAIPNYVQLLQDILDNYQAELIEKRKLVNQALGL